MTTVADIFRRYGPAYRAKHGSRLLPSHRRAMRDIERCRTEALGGHVYHCPECDERTYSYHSCKNRHCPTCQNDDADRWLQRQQQLLLPVPYFMLTFTLPGELRAVTRSNQKCIYNLLFRTSAAATQELARDPRFVGGAIGMVGVLQTWQRDLRYHPHVHYIVAGGAVHADTERWVSSRDEFFVHVKPLSVLFRAKFRDALRSTELFDLVPAHVWSKDWVVHCQPADTGVEAVTYLAPYIFRVAISNNRILAMNEDDETVTFRYIDASTGEPRRCTVTAEEFIRRFLQHVLPKGFVKVRYYGLFSPSKRELLVRVRQQLGCTDDVQSTTEEPDNSGDTLRCPQCGTVMTLQKTIRPRSRHPP